MAPWLSTIREKEDVHFVEEGRDRLSWRRSSQRQPSQWQRLRHTQFLTRPKPNYHQAIQVKKSAFSKNQKTNPVAYWKVANMKINAVAFSPNHRHLAMSFDDGSVRIIDYLKEKLLSVFFGYFGAMLCVCWSPDGKYLVTGGQGRLTARMVSGGTAGHWWRTAQGTIVGSTLSLLIRGGATKELQVWERWG